MRLRTACAMLAKGEPSFDTMGELHRTGNRSGSKMSPGYEFTIYATASSNERGIRNVDGAMAFVHVSDDGYVTIDLEEFEEEFPKELLECVVRRAEILR